MRLCQMQIESWSKTQHTAYFGFARVIKAIVNCYCNVATTVQEHEPVQPQKSIRSDPTHSTITNRKIISVDRLQLIMHRTVAP